MNSDGTPKPVGTAIHNLTMLLADTGATAPTFATRTLSYTLGGTTARDHAMVMQSRMQLLGVAVERERCRAQRHPHSAGV
jgi:serralysin